MVSNAIKFLTKERLRLFGERVDDIVLRHIKGAGSVEKTASALGLEKVTVLAVLGATTLLAGCAESGPVSVNGACGIFSPITYSRSHDTAETKRQVREHNAAGAASCGWSKK